VLEHIVDVDFPYEGGISLEDAMHTLGDVVFQYYTQFAILSSSSGVLL